jgi:hypothetical protein
MTWDGFGLKKESGNIWRRIQLDFAGTICAAINSSNSTFRTALLS